MSSPSVISEVVSADALFRAHAPFVVSFLRRMGVDADDVDDALQEVFLIAHRQGGYRTDSPAKPTTWLASIAYRIASTYRRRFFARLVRIVTTGIIHRRPADESSPADAVGRKEVLARIEAALECLRPDQRALILLYEIEGESCAALAQAFDVPVGTVHSRLHAARKRLHKAYLHHDVVSAAASLMDPVSSRAARANSG